MCWCPGKGGGRGRCVTSEEVRLDFFLGGGDGGLIHGRGPVFEKGSGGDPPVAARLQDGESAQMAACTGRALDRKAWMRDKTASATAPSSTQPAAPAPAPVAPPPPAPSSPDVRMCSPSSSAEKRLHTPGSRASQTPATPLQGASSPPTATEGHTSILPRRPQAAARTLPLVLSSVLRVVSLPLVVPTLPIVRR